MTSLKQKGQWRHFPQYELRRPPETQIFAQYFHCCHRIKLIVVTTPHATSQTGVFNWEDFTPWKFGFPTDSCFLWRSFYAFGLLPFQICLTIRNFPRPINCIGPFFSPLVFSKNKQKSGRNWPPTSPTSSWSRGRAKSGETSPDVSWV